MTRLLALPVLLVAALPASAHFIWLAPHQGDVRMVFSEDTEPDPAVPIAKIAKTEVHIRAGAKPVPAPKTAGEDHYIIKLPGKGPAEVGAVCEYGVLTKSGDPFLLCYYAKTLLGGAEPKGMNHPLEIFPAAGKEGTFEVRWQGKPAAGLEVVVDAPEETTKKLKTDAQGRITVPTPKSGTLLIRAKHVEAKAGARGEEQFKEVRHYATLTVTK
jgi:uncharacterized GH25 family protein